VTVPVPVLARAVRDGVAESTHHGTLVVADASGRVVTALGDPERPVYVRSAVKPFQALGTLSLLDRAGFALPARGLAIACSSHDGASGHQIEAAHLLALAGLDESALRCPPDLPTDLSTLLEQRRKEPLAHNCSGKHAAFLLGTVAAGEDPARYLDPRSAVQRAALEALRATTGTEPTGPGVDGCGAPAFLVPLRGLAVAFARLAAGSHGLERVRGAMRRYPKLIGGLRAQDTLLMEADERVVAKRGAEGVLSAGVRVAGRGTFGVAVKVEDGAARAAGPAVATALAALGIQVPAGVREPVVLGGGVPHGQVEVDPAVVALPLADVYHGASDG